MQTEASTTQLTENTAQSEAISQVFFDADTLALFGSYIDELSAWRAKKTWTVTLERLFLLNDSTDFKLTIQKLPESERYVLRCEFLSACARYAFWRLTNHQTPEAQYIIETAHIPDSIHHHQEFLSVPDMRPVHEEPLILTHNIQANISETRTILSRIQEMILKLCE